jgi:ribosomal protein S18 acetylase RimI-like enzyme
MTQDLFIRPAALTDLPAIYEICVKTAADGTDATGLLRDDVLVGQFFAAPYLHYDITNCFVVDQNGFAIGYIIGATDTEDFNEWMNNRWLPNLRAAYPLREADTPPLEAYVLSQIHNGIETQNICEHYPSHLHIDLLPEAQGKGLGRKLIQTYVECLIEKQSKGLHLGVSAANTNAMAFYERIGFETYHDIGDAVFLTMSLGSKLKSVK